LILTGLLWIGSAQAVHNTGMFELDGNVVHNAGTTRAYDWSSLFGRVGTMLVTPGPDKWTAARLGVRHDTDAIDTTYSPAARRSTTRSTKWPAVARPRTTRPPWTSPTPMIQIPAGAPDNAGDNVLYLGWKSKPPATAVTTPSVLVVYKDKTVGCARRLVHRRPHDGDLFIDGLFTNGGGGPTSRSSAGTATTHRARSLARVRRATCAVW